MSLFTFAVGGAVLSLLLMATGFVWLGLKHQFEVSRMDPDDAGVLHHVGVAMRKASFSGG